MKLYFTITYILDVSDVNVVTNMLGWLTVLGPEADEGLRRDVKAVPYMRKFSRYVISRFSLMIAKHQKFII